MNKNFLFFKDGNLTWPRKKRKYCVVVLQLGIAKYTNKHVISMSTKTFILKRIYIT